MSGIGVSYACRPMRLRGIGGISVSDACDTGSMSGIGVSYACRPMRLRGIGGIGVGDACCTSRVGSLGESGALIRCLSSMRGCNRGSTAGEDSGSLRDAAASHQRHDAPTSFILPLIGGSILLRYPQTREILIGGTSPRLLPGQQASETSKQTTSGCSMSDEVDLVITKACCT